MLDLIESLKSHEASHRLRDRAVEACWKWIVRAMREGELRHLDLDDLELQFERCALVFDSALISHPYIETRFGIHLSSSSTRLPKDDRPHEIGHYRLITTLDGSSEDDYFVLNAAID